MVRLDGITVSQGNLIQTKKRDDSNDDMLLDPSLIEVLPVDQYRNESKLIYFINKSTLSH